MLARSNVDRGGYLLLTQNIVIKIIIFVLNASFNLIVESNRKCLYDFDLQRDSIVTGGQEVIK